MLVCVFLNMHVRTAVKDGAFGPDRTHVSRQRFAPRQTVIFSILIKIWSRFDARKDGPSRNVTTTSVFLVLMNHSHTNARNSVRIIVRYAFREVLCSILKIPTTRKLLAETAVLAPVGVGVFQFLIPKR